MKRRRARCSSDCNELASSCHFLFTQRGQWQGEGRLIDLYGRDNLVLDRQFEIAYLDSFGVFFHTDVRHAIHVVDDELEARMAVSARRLDYLESLI